VVPVAVLASLIPGRSQALLTALDPQLQRMVDFAALVQQVPDGPDRMPPGHSRPGKAHDEASGFALRRLVAVNRAIGAGRLGGAVGTFLQPPLGVLHESLALGAQAPVNQPMVMVAVDPRHAAEGLVFVQQPSFERVHGTIIEAFVIHQFDPGQQRRGRAI